MSTPAVQRKLAAILAADVAGYSRLEQIPLILEHSPRVPGS